MPEQLGAKLAFEESLFGNKSFVLSPSTSDSMRTDEAVGDEGRRKLNWSKRSQRRMSAVQPCSRRLLARAGKKWRGYFGLLSCERRS